MPQQFLQAMTVEENIVRTVNAAWRQAGSIETAPFKPAPYMAIPVMGGGKSPSLFDPRQSGVYLRCLSNGAQLSLLNAPAEWYLATVHAPDGWCDGLATVAAHSAGEKYRAGLGTPFEIGPMTWAMAGRLGALLAAVIAFSLTSISVIPIVALARYPLLHRLTFVLAAPSALGCVWFLQQWYAGSVEISAALGLVYLLGPVSFFAHKSWRRPVEVDEQTAWVFLLALGVTFLVVLVAPYALIPLQNGFWFPAYAFFPAAWSTDNLMSEMIAKAILAFGRIHPEYLGPWSMNDRGVIQTGDFIGLMTLPGVKDLISGSVGGFYIVNLYGAAIQSLAIPALVVLVCRRIAPAVNPFAATLLLATTPFLLMNTFYIWPKISGGILVVMALFLLEEAIRKASVGALSGAMVAFALGTMNHSASLFSIATIIIYCGLSIVTNRHRLEGVTSLVRTSALALLAMELTLVGVSHLATVEPKSSWPIMYLLTGQGAFGLSSAEVIDRTVEFYRGMTLTKFLDLKRSQLMDLVWMQNPLFEADYPGISILGAIRAREFFSLAPALGPGLLVGAPLALVAWLQRYPSRMSKFEIVDEDMFDTSMMLAVSSAVTLVLYALVFSQPMIAHHLPYGAVISVILAAMLILTRYRAIFHIATGIQVAAAALIWFFGSYYTWFHELPAP
ncbi:MAG: hypothetical protein JO234_12100 [Hyphomicrobiales bacterium]|nr:hypothetical protein [Hyphomicrobiales bacterium]